MKWVLAFSLLFLANCASHTTAQMSQNSPAQNVPANESSNKPDQYTEAIRLNKETVAALEVQNEKYKAVPDEFNRIDFENFTYPTTYPKNSITLKDGEYEYENKKSLGGGTFNLSEVYFVDLTGDKVKEALVLIVRIDCGGSCDGGAYLLYVFGQNRQKPKLLWSGELGSAGYCCGLKTLTIMDRKIMFDLYGRCNTKMKEAMTKEEFFNTGKFSSIGFTEYIFGFNETKFVREKTEFHPVGKIYHLNQLPEIRIND